MGRRDTVNAITAQDRGRRFARLSSPPMITGPKVGSLPTGGSDDAQSMDQEEITMIDRVCMFCGKVYGKKPGHGVTDESHGVCPACRPNALVLLEQGPGGASVALSARRREVACA